METYINASMSTHLCVCAMCGKLHPIGSIMIIRILFWTGRSSPRIFRLPSYLKLFNKMKAYIENYMNPWSSEHMHATPNLNVIVNKILLTPKSPYHTPIMTSTPTDYFWSLGKNQDTACCFVAGIFFSIWSFWDSSRLLYVGAFKHFGSILFHACNLPILLLGIWIFLL
jgi:hypothetical protein